MTPEHRAKIRARCDAALSMPCEVYDELLETDIPDLLAEVERLEAEVAQLGVAKKRLQNTNKNFRIENQRLLGELFEASQLIERLQE